MSNADVGGMSTSFNSTDEALAQIEIIRKAMMAVDNWCLEQLTNNQLESKVQVGLTTQARMSRDGAREITARVVSLVRRLNDHVLSAASTASVLARTVDDYVDLCKNPAKPPLRGTGLKVN